MVNIELLVKELQNIGIHFFTGVPDSLLNDFCLYITENLPCNNHVMAANEGNAIAIATGNYLATGDIPLVYMQNSGVGNSMNPLLSLTHKDVYGIPMVLVIGWRGDPSVKDHAQHKKQGELTPVLMKDMDIPYDILDCDETVLSRFKWAVKTAKEISSPVALLVKKAILTKKEKHQMYKENGLMSREEAISVVIDTIGRDAVYLATTGRATRELHEQLIMKGISSEIEFLNVGAMGHLSSIGLGIALARSDKKVVVFDGDAASIMHMGSFATIGRYTPKNLIHIVLNNGVNESVGGQPSPGYIVNLSGVAESCRIKTAGRYIDNKKELSHTLLSLIEDQDVPVFIDVHVRQGIRSDLPKLAINHQDSKKAIQKYLTKK
ncbi:MAG: phosphonopyruvate decarboxylase [Muribaculaceae bacterium]|nr:phosphonopyruvate decarboxylase [Muribaculaceae bacterium]